MRVYAMGPPHAPPLVALHGMQDVALSLRPVVSIWGVGKSLGSQLEKDGLTTVKQLRSISKHNLTKKYGKIGKRLFDFARGEDNRIVQPNNK